MKVFDDVTFEWDGKPYTIPANKLLGAIARVENVVTIGELLETQTTRGTVKMAVLARAFGELLRYAGCKVTDDEVYLGMFGGNSGAAQAALMAVIGLMVPPSVRATMSQAVAAVADEPAQAAAPFPAADTPS